MPDKWAQYAVPNAAAKPDKWAQYAQPAIPAAPSPQTPTPPITDTISAPPTFGEKLKSMVLHPLNSLEAASQPISRPANATPGEMLGTDLHNVGAGMTSVFRHPIDTVVGMVKAPIQAVTDPKAAFQALNQGGPVAGATMLGQGLATAGLGKAVGASLGKAGTATKRVVTGDLDRPIPGSDTTPRQRYSAMTETGVSPDAAEATNSPVLKMAKAVNQNSLTATPVYDAARARNIQSLNDYTQGTLDRMSTLSPEEGGAAVQRGLLENQGTLKQNAETGFKTLDSERGNQPIPGSAALQKQAQGILEQNAAYYNLHPELEPRQATAIVRNLANNGPSPKAGPKVIPGFGAASATPPEATPPRVPNFSELHRLRSDLLDFNNTNPDLVKNQANGWISQLAGGADSAITSGEGGLTPTQTQIFRDSNAAWKDMKGTYDNPQSPLYSAVRTDTPSRLVNGISQTPEMASNLRARLGEQGVGPIQRGVAEKTLGTTKEGNYNFRNFQGNFNKLAPGYRDSLYAPEQLRALDNIGQTGSVLNLDSNPSGTAKLGQKIAEVGAVGGSFLHPLALAGEGLYHAGQYGLARAMNSPRLVDWMMRPGAPVKPNPLIPPVVGVLSGRSRQPYQP